MEEQALRLKTAISTIVRIQKILEPGVQTVHGIAKLAPPEMQSLRYVAQNPGCMSGAVAAFLGVVPTTMTSIVDRLVKRGLVTRARPEENRRAVALHLTEEGALLFEQLDGEELASANFMLDALKEDERAHFVDCVQRIAQALSDVEDQAR